MCVWRTWRQNPNRESGRDVDPTLGPNFALLSAVHPDSIPTRTATSCASWLRLMHRLCVLTLPDLGFSYPDPFWSRRPPPRRLQIQDTPALTPVPSHRTSGLCEYSHLASPYFLRPPPSSGSHDIDLSGPDVSSLLCDLIPYTCRLLIQSWLYQTSSAKTDPASDPSALCPDASDASPASHASCASWLALQCPATSHASRYYLATFLASWPNLAPSLRLDYPRLFLSSLLSPDAAIAPHHLFSASWPTPHPCSCNHN